MDDIERRLFHDFCNHYFNEYQLEVWRFEGRKAPLSRWKYFRNNYSFLKEKWKEEGSLWYSKGEVS
jgi:hypothetical protein